ncbi:MAG: copper homeostasis protein CutC [Bacteroidaceae bacterium]
MENENRRSRILEVCCADFQSIRAAVDGGAQRLELCQALEIGGVTPNTDMIDYAVGTGVQVHVLIRPRGGNFVYSPEEIQSMVQDIRMAHEKGASGVVIGALTSEGDIDTDTCRLLMGQAKGMSITFHRAFDECRNPLRSLEDIISLGCHRLLTSGHEGTVTEGIGLLKQLVDQAGQRIIILPGCGVNPGNARQIIEATGANELHGSLRKDGHTDKKMVRQTLLAINAESLASPI